MSSAKENASAPKVSAAAVPTNAIYGSPSPDFSARCIYFYYLTESNDAKYNVRTFFIEYPDKISDIENKIVEILDSIRSGKLMPCGWALGDLKWRRISYIVIAYDDWGQQLKQNDAITIDYDKYFKGGQDLLLKTPYQNITCFYCENYVGPATQKIQITVNHGHGTPFQITTHNDSGTNMGPPIPPP